MWSAERTLAMKEILTDVGLLVLRLTGGLTMLLAHGWPKLQKFSDLSERFPDPLGLGSSLSLGLAIFAEVVCAALVTLGVLTRAASVALLVTMGVAFFIVHADDPFARKELALMYFGIYLALIFLGGGKYSVLKSKKLPLS